VKGTTGGVSVAGMLRLLCGYGKTGVLEVESSAATGNISLRQGAIVGASVEGTKKTGTKAAVIELLLVLEKGSFSFTEETAVEGTDAGLCVEDLILEASREFYSRHKNMVELQEYLPPVNEVMKAARMQKGKKLTVSFLDDEWNLLMAFNGDVNCGTVLEECGLERERAEVILYALLSAGLVRRSRFKIPEITQIARDSMGNIGAAIVESVFLKLKTDRNRMGMKDFIAVLNEMENAFADIAGRTKAKEITEKIWAAAK